MAMAFEELIVYRAERGGVMADKEPNDRHPGEAMSHSG